MQKVRFSQVVKKCGHPAAYLVLSDPKKDRALQAAAKAQRVLTVMQSTKGTKADWGEVGFHPGAGRQYLIFPKSLAAHAGKAFVGIKYDLLSEATTLRPARSHEEHQPAKKKAKAPAPPPEPPAETKPKPKPKPVPAKKKKTHARPAETKSKPDSKAKPPPPPAKKESAEVTTLKRQVKRAMHALENGRQVAAFNLLQKIVDD